MENTPQSKKINWTMIILIIILVPILLLVYKFISKNMDENNIDSQNIVVQTNPNSTSMSQSTDFPTGTWYRNDPSINSKYIFDAPQNINGTLQGQVDMVYEDRSEGKVNYEVIDNGKLKISDPQASFPAWELKYTYSPNGQSLEIIANGNSATYVRNPVYAPTVNNSHSSNSTQATSKLQNPSVNTSQLISNPVGGQIQAKPADFSRTWSNANGSGSDKFTLTIELQQAGSAIDGFIYSENYDNSGSLISSVQWSIGGSINGNTAKVDIRDSNGRKVSAATLVKNGNGLSFSMSGSNPNLPKTAKLTGR